MGDAVRRSRGGEVHERGDERHALIDEYRLLVFPLLLGGGKRLFTDDATRRPLTLVSTTTSMTGVSITTYRRADG
ncbi:dihydrofolate reductase family protein [Streptomyces niveus]|uniref:dihydrofolate reductase family protein n=1 Tax=Streptomyces niveus TaxID=193462 RepID=UPI003441640F